MEMLGKVVDVDFNSGIFVTMNPAGTRRAQQVTALPNSCSVGKGYGGRSKLPDNLKQLFRPVAMSKPDLNLIAEVQFSVIFRLRATTCACQVILFAEGFLFAQKLAEKLVSIYALNKEQLSPQQHYDWGLRALKSVLELAGSLLFKEKQNGPVQLAGFHV